mmetsp:Transcript_15306/g.47579  ORF Transcript_15306/g.47579 Transcript_15306/m.47579 type:complete len:330 (+) Transcript_15306:2851-3840(+)
MRGERLQRLERVLALPRGAAPTAVHALIAVARREWIGCGAVRSLRGAVEGAHVKRVLQQAGSHARRIKPDAQLRHLCPGAIAVAVSLGLARAAVALLCSGDANATQRRLLQPLAVVVRVACVVALQHACDAVLGLAGQLHGAGHVHRAAAHWRDHGLLEVVAHALRAPREALAVGGLQHCLAPLLLEVPIREECVARIIILKSAAESLTAAEAVGLAGANVQQHIGHYLHTRATGCRGALFVAHRKHSLCRLQAAIVRTAAHAKVILPIGTQRHAERHLVLIQDTVTGAGNVENLEIGILWIAVALKGERIADGARALDVPYLAQNRFR